MYQSNSLSINGIQNTEEALKTSMPSSHSQSEALNQIFEEGEVITGKVVKKNEFITMDFEGKQINIPEKTVQNVQVGQNLTFRVRKVEERLIELEEVKESYIEEDYAGEQYLEESKPRNAFRVDKDKVTYDVKKGLEQKSNQSDKVVYGLLGKMSDVLKQTTELDLINLRKEGFSIDAMDANQIYEGIQQLKEREASKVQIEESKEQPKSKDIGQRLKEENIPVTKEVIQQVQTALNLGSVIPQINENTIAYMIKNEMSPTIENIYKAHFNGNKQPYQVKNPLSEEAWKQLKPQVIQVIKEAEFQVNEQTLADGRWLIEGDMALTEDNLTYKYELEKAKDQWNESYGMDKIVSGLKDGLVAKDVVVIQNNISIYDDTIEKISNIQDKAIVLAVEKNIPLTIENLDVLQNDINEGKEVVDGRDIRIPEYRDVQAEQHQDTNSVEYKDVQEADRNKLQELKEQDKHSAENNDNQGTEYKNNQADITYQAIKAKRQLEEIRLKMTKEATNTLEKKGFRIDTEPLEKVVEELRTLENQQYQRLCEEAGLEGSEEQIKTITETKEQISYLKELPSYVLGKTLEDRLTHTVPSLVEEGTPIKNELLRAGEAYETLMTVPSSEYGDSIQKAFRNMAPLLEELNIQNTEENQRAVRMLAYNHMEINHDNVNQMKVYDGQVSNLIKHLNPAVTVQLLKDGINPLDVPIAKLSQKINEMMKEQSLTTEDKYSVYLQKLEKNQGISETERKSYIGIYRLLYQVEKSDGAAVGALVKADREITLNNLLTAVKTIKKGSIDSVIDDDFGLLESVTRSKETILEQVEAVFQGNDMNRETSSHTLQLEPQEEVKTELYQKLLKDVMNELSPNKLSGLEQSMNPAVNETSSQEYKIWSLIKDQPLELLLKDLKQIQVDDQVEEEIARENLTRLRNIYQNSEQSVKFLNQYKVPQTTMNIQLAKQLMSEGYIDIKKEIKREKNIKENLEYSLKEMSNLADNLVDKNSMNEAYENLVQSVKDTLMSECEKESASSVNIAQLKMLGSQMTFLKTLAEKEYYQIPVETEQGMIHMNVTIIRNENVQGKVSINIPSEKKGTIKADFAMNQGMLKGFVYCEGRKELENIKSILPTIEQQLAIEGIPVKQINVTLNRKEIEALEKNITQEIQGQHNSNGDVEKDLYQVAKTFVRFIKQIYDEE